MPDPNVECTRCGYRWFSEGYEEEEIVPELCTRCYREDVRPIPAEPSWLERKVERSRDRLARIPDIFQKKRRQFVLWKENHRYLLDLLVFAVAIFVILGIVYMFIFRWG
ncbi:MAG: hypothetical protein SVU32_08040 [Candidatus Nanohaloarchaea archaeon]|nr:hypothetical protein [Candidatus Nanohaloarchaea archaeon]